MSAQPVAENLFRTLGLEWNQSFTQNTGATKPGAQPKRRSNDIRNGPPSVEFKDVLNIIRETFVVGGELTIEGADHIYREWVRTLENGEGVRHFILLLS